MSPAWKGTVKIVRGRWMEECFARRRKKRAPCHTRSTVLRVLTPSGGINRVLLSQKPRKETSLFFSLCLLCVGVAVSGPWNAMI